jgi:hypothetical protein
LLAQVALQAATWETWVAKQEVDALRENDVGSCMEGRLIQREDDALIGAKVKMGGEISEDLT